MKETGDDLSALTGKLIAHACTAGACREMARIEPAAKRGLIRAADFHSARVRALAEELTQRAGGRVSALPGRPRVG